MWNVIWRHRRFSVSTSPYIAQTDKKIWKRVVLIYSVNGIINVPVTGWWIKNNSATYVWIFSFSSKSGTHFYHSRNEVNKLCFIYEGVCLSYLLSFWFWAVIYLMTCFCCSQLAMLIRNLSFEDVNQQLLASSALVFRYSARFVSLSLNCGINGISHRCTLALRACQTLGVLSVCEGE